MALRDSPALPRYAYGDPAKIVEVQQLRTLGCAVCQRVEYLFDLPVCTSGLTFPSCKKGQRNGYKLTPEAGG